MFIILTICLITIISVIQSVQYCPNLVRNNDLCRCRESDITLELSCTIINVTKLYYLSNSSNTRYLTTLKVYLEQITDLPSSALRFRNLNSLTISGYSLVSIDEQAFVGLEEELKYLYFQGTSLRQIPVTAISRLRNLEILEMSRSQIISLDMSLHNRALHKLIFSDNRISTILNNSFPPTLTSLDLINNRLHTLNNSLRGNLSELKKLYISNNSINSLIGQLNDATRLTILIAKQNTIQNIDDGSLATLSELQILYLSNNYIHQIVDGLRGLYQLLEVDISHNSLTHIHAMAFSDLSKLKILNLARNNLRNLEEGIFDCLSSLEILDVSHNNLQNMDFITSHRLGELNLDEEMENCNFGNYSKLRNLKIAGNEITCDVAVEQTIDYLELMQIHLSGNPCGRYI